jgi:tRNA-2-methylthio-N6-dimethylallyladenosine synthase
MYSPRPGTAAADFDQMVNTEVKKDRLQRLQRLQLSITSQISASLVGTSAMVLVEGPSKSDPVELTGRTSCNRIVNFKAQVSVGAFTELTITQAYANSFRGIERGVPCS